MKSTKMLAVLAGALVLVVAAVVGAAFQLYWLSVACLGLLLVANLAVDLDTNRRTRYLPRKVKNLLRTVSPAISATPGDGGRIRSVAPGEAAPPAPKSRSNKPPKPAAQPDVRGAVRLIQAQYIGRLDRAQSALEAAAEDLRAARDER